MRLFVLASLALALATGFAGCFNPDQPTCSYICSESEPRCPDSYECRADNYCHLVGSTEACGFADASVSTDLSAVTTDMSHPSDLSDHD
jgi:hypothetical protein